MTGVTSVVDQLLGSSRIPASAAPRTGPSALQPDPRPKKPSKPKPLRPRARLVSALDDVWSPVGDLYLRARVAESFAYRVPWAKGMRREYRRRKG
jgi:hypothetical protein